MTKLDPWTSLKLRAEFLTHCMGEDVGSFRPSRKRDAMLASFEAADIAEELGLQLRDPKDEMPWITGDVEFGSWLHWHWTAMRAVYPSEFWRGVSAMADGEVNGVEPALVFLEADPWCFRSGYAKQTIARLMRKVVLTEPQRDRLLVALLNGVTKGPRWEFREYCKTARAFATPEFRIQLRQLSAGSRGRPRPRLNSLMAPRSGVQERAQWMLEKLDR
jgi:hypothetical protein